MFMQSKFAMFVGIFCMVRKGSAKETSFTPPHPTRNPDYLGSQPTKAYYFPWMVSIHLETGRSREFFGSGSILTPQYVISSMDSFVRENIAGRKTKDEDDDWSYFQLLANLTMYTGGVWGNGPLLVAPNEYERPEWFQRRRIREIVMFSDPNTKTATLARLGTRLEPKKIEEFKRSPFGFSMSICLLEVLNEDLNGRITFEWKRTTLPVPLFADKAAPLRTRLSSVVDNLEAAPFETLCWVAGWRLSDSRLVAHKVIYVPFEECSQIYCRFDKTACGNWPVNETHVCFRSLTFDDLCWVDQGSALYCKAQLDSVLAILTSAPTCGHGGLPGVYTLVHHALKLHEKIGKVDRYDPVVGKERKYYTPPPANELIPDYR